MRVSQYLQYLPASFQEDPFLGQFLLAFERVLTGVLLDDNPRPTTSPPELGLEQIYDGVARQFDPNTADPGFLPWLAGWVATSLRQDWDDALRRRFISNIASLYRRRGTLGYLRDLLRVYLNDNKTVVVDDSGDRPYYFEVSFSVSADPTEVARVSKLAQAIIEQEKPAHTYYRLTINFPKMQIIDHPDPVKGPHSLRVGVNTLLGTQSYEVTP
ncbi:MAG TPA: phage tail protein [Polyangia bacterium]|nr:phage tail protein [Polyangia bacterium]